MTIENIYFELIEHIGTIDVFPSGWTRELNIVKWNDGEPKFDLRDWAPDHEHLSRGLTLSEGEVLALADTIMEYFSNN